MQENHERSLADQWLGAVWLLFVRLALVTGGVYVVYRVRWVIVWTLLAVLLACTLEPISTWVERRPRLRGMTRNTRKLIAVSAVFAALIGALSWLGVFILSPLSMELGELIRNTPRHLATLQERLELWRQDYLALPEQFRGWVESQDLPDLFTQATQHVSDMALSALESGFVIIELILIPVLAFYFLLDSRTLKRDFVGLLPRRRRRDSVRLLRDAARVLQSYAVGQLILAMLAGVIVWPMLALLGIPYALALAVLAAATRFIPVVGPLIGGVPIVLIALLQSTETGVIVLIAFTVMHLVESKVVMPRIIGYRVDLHPAVVIVVLLIGAEFFGLWGMFLAPPIAAVIKVLVRYLVVEPKRAAARRRARAVAPPIRAPQALPLSEARLPESVPESLDVDPAAVVSPRRGARPHGVRPR